MPWTVSCLSVTLFTAYVDLCSFFTGRAI